MTVAIVPVNLIQADLALLMRVFTNFSDSITIYSICLTWKPHDFPITVRLLTLCPKHYRSFDAIQINPELRPSITTRIQPLYRNHLPVAQTAQIFSYS